MKPVNCVKDPRQTEEIAPNHREPVYTQGGIVHARESNNAANDFLRAVDLKNHNARENRGEEYKGFADLANGHKCADNTREDDPQARIDLKDINHGDLLQLNSLDQADRPLRNNLHRAQGA